MWIKELGETSCLDQEGGIEQKKPPLPVEALVRP